MDFSVPPEVEALRREALDFGRAAAAKMPKEYAGVWSSREFSLAMGRKGWLGMTWPTQHGGHGRSPLERFIVQEALISVGAPMGRTWVSDRQIGPALLAFGSDAQRRRFLPGIIRGEDCWSIGLSESEAGSDVSAMRTKAVREGDFFVVTGRKMWTSFAIESEFLYLIARSEFDCPAHESLSELIVDLKSPGVTVQPIRDMTGGHRFCEITFDEVRVPAENLVGSPGGAFRQVMRQLEFERAGIDRLMSNRLLYEAALEAADTQDPVVRQEIADLEIGFRTGRLMVMRSLLGKPPKAYSALTKVFCTQHQQRISAFAERALEAAGLSDAALVKAMCYSPAYTIQGGTSEVLNNVIGERLLGLPR